jgi:peptidoglycan/LPS O-acetylase OafA/YrhL
MLNLTPLRLLVAGEFAVATFFVLSGFVSARVTCSPVLEQTLSRRIVLLFRSILHHTPS